MLLCCLLGDPAGQVPSRFPVCPCWESGMNFLSTAHASPSHIYMQGGLVGFAPFSVKESLKFLWRWVTEIFSGSWEASHLNFKLRKDTIEDVPEMHRA